MVDDDRTPSRPDPIIVTAHHEAAHVVITYRVAGWADALVSIVPRADRGTLGHAVDNDSNGADPDHMAARILSCYAGGHAQRRVDPVSGDEGCDDDDEEARAVLYQFSWENREQEFRDRSRALVEHHWSEIAAVATELLRLQVLDDTEIQALADGAAGDPDAAADLARYRHLRRDDLDAWRALVIRGDYQGGA